MRDYEHCSLSKENLTNEHESVKDGDYGELGTSCVPLEKYWLVLRIDSIKTVFVQ